MDHLEHIILIKEIQIKLARSLRIQAGKCDRSGISWWIWLLHRKRSSFKLDSVSITQSRYWRTEFQPTVSWFWTARQVQYTSISRGNSKRYQTWKYVSLWTNTECLTKRTVTELLFRSKSSSSLHQTIPISSINRTSFI